MGIEMEVWAEERNDFEEIIATLQRAHQDYYGKSISRENAYWDAVRYDLYAVVPIYAEHIL